MRLIKMLGLAGIAAMTAMAFVGASSAMAEPEHPEIVLCEQLELICENPYPNPTEIHLESLKAEPPKLLTNVGTIECENALSIITLLNKLSVLIEGHILALTLGGCKLGSTACTATANELGGISLTPAETKLLAKAKLITLESKTTSVTFKCGGFVNCTYSAGEATELLAHSDEEGHLLLLAKETPLTGKGFLCPKESKWDINLHAVNLDKELTLKLGLWIEL